MNKIIWVLIFLYFTSVSWSEDTSVSRTTERRIEEDKRASLQGTEAVIEEDRVPSIRRPTMNREYFERLISQPIARRVDGVYVIGRLIPGFDTRLPLEEQYRLMQDEKLFPVNMKQGHTLDAPLKKGELAYMLCKVLGIKGGIHMRIFGVSPRYALFELVYEGIMISGDQRDVVSGKELAYTFIQAADYATHKTPHAK